jgi:hypothetical protein
MEPEPDDEFGVPNQAYLDDMSRWFEEYMDEREVVDAVTGHFFALGWS